MTWGLLFENRPALYFCNYKENKENNIRMLDTLFIEDFIDSMEEHFHFYNHNWQWISVAQTKDLKQYLWYGIKKIYFIGRNECILKKMEWWPVLKRVLVQQEAECPLRAGDHRALQRLRRLIVSSVEGSELCADPLYRCLLVGEVRGTALILVMLKC